MLRRNTLSALALAAALLSLLIHASPPVDAFQGDPVNAGEYNLAQYTTTIDNSGGGVIALCDSTTSNGMNVCGAAVGVSAWGTTGVRGTASGTGASDAGVLGTSPNAAAPGVEGTNGSSGTGVSGQAANGGTGVFGTNTGSTGIGVHGKTAGVGSAVYGEATTDGVAVNSNAQDGTGVRAESNSGLALDVVGRVRFLRSGVAVVNGSPGTPRSQVTIYASLTGKTVVLTTPQTNLPGIWVRAAVTNLATGQITFYLNNSVTSAFNVGWMTFEKP